MNIMQREIRATTENVLEQVPDGFQSTHDVLNGSCAFDIDTYLADDIAPTLLDPYFDDTYVIAGYDEMIDRLRGKISVDSPVFHLVADEIRQEHTLRCSKNSRGMDRLKTALDGFTIVPDDLAAVIRKARTGTATTFEAAKLLALFPELDSIEVMKATYPLDRDAINQAQRHYMQVFMKESFPYNGAVTYEHDNGFGHTKSVDREVANDRNKIMIFKTREATISLGGVDMELMSRRSYVDVGPYTELLQGTTGAKHLPIALSKYLRRKRNDPAVLS